MPGMDLSSYRALFGTRGVLGVLLSAQLARLPVIATFVPAAFLAKDLSGSFGWSGVVAGAQSVGMAIGGPLWSRVADRRGARTVLIATGMVWSLLMVVLALLPADMYRLMPVVSGLAGALVPPVGPTMRAAWPRLVEGRALRTAYAMDATFQELLFIGGPMLGAVMVSFASPRAGLLVAAIAAGTAIWWFGLKLPTKEAHDRTDDQRLTARQLLWHRHRLAIIVAFGLCVMSFASVSIGIVAYADEHGNRLIAGVLEAVWAVGSLIGGVIVGALAGRRGAYAWRRVAFVCAGMFVCVFATWRPVTLGAGLVLAGFAIAPAFGLVYERLGTLTPATTRTEIFGWMNTGAMLGAAAGSAVAGAIVDHLGVPYVFAMATVLTGIGAVTLIGIPPHRPGAEAAESEPRRVTVSD
jgi:MFS family permease